MKGSSGSTSGGTAGTGSNVPSYSGSKSGSAAGTGNYNNKKVDTNFGVDKKVTKTETAPGAVNKLQVALMVDKSVPKATYDSLQKTVATAAGLDQTTRGDTLTAMQVAFPKAVTPKAGPVPTTMLGPLKWVGLGLASLLFLFFMARGMKKRESENLGTPAWLTTIDEPVSLAQLEAGAGMPDFVANTSNSMLAPRVPDASLHQLDQLMEREPERVAAQVKAWMAED
jgi:flagellar M-ring protein FliF